MSLPALAVIALASVVGLAWVFARWYAMPTRTGPEGTPADHGLTFEAVSFTSGRTRVDAWLMPRKGGIGSLDATIVAVHGWSSSKASMLPVAVTLHDAGFNVLLFDARGHGASGSDGPITIRKFAEDIMAGIDYLEQVLGSATGRLGVVGHSIGGGSAILAASVDSRIDSVVSSSAFANPATLTQRTMRRLRLPRGPVLWTVCRILESWLGMAMTDVAPEHRIALVTAPVLLLHGSADRFVPPSDMEAIYAGARTGNVDRVVLTGARHADVLNDDRYRNHAARFFLRHLANGGKEPGP